MRGLTRQEALVLEDRNAGLTAKESATHLGLSEKTVKNYRTRVNSKLSCAMKWQPIETAPVNEWLLLIDDQPDWAGNMRVCKRFVWDVGTPQEYDGGWWTAGGPNGGYSMDDEARDFTHWKRLPDPPEDAP